MPTLFLHIGYSKTGTTFLQKEVFTSIPDVHYLDRPSIDLIPPKMPGDGIFRRIFAAAPEIWLEHGPEILATLGIDSHEYTLVSDENVCEMKQTYQLIAAHLKALMEKYRGNVKVILTIRRQADKLASHYAQYSHKIQGASQSHFEQWVRNMIHTASGYYGEEGLRGIMIDYKLMHSTLRSVLPSHNICIIPYEMMKEDLLLFINTLLSFMSINMNAATLIDRLQEGGKVKKRNVRSSSEYKWTLRPRSLEGAMILNLRPTRLFQAFGLPTKVPFRWPDLDRDDEIHLSPELRKEVMGVYETSNRATAKAIDVNLGQYGYY